MRQSNLGGWMVLIVGTLAASCAGAPAVSAGPPVPIAASLITEAEHRLADVMERIDVDQLKADLPVIEAAGVVDTSPWAQARLAILWHEVALNLGFLSTSPAKGYGKKSYDLLTRLEEEGNSPLGLRPYIAAYRASALALWAGEEGNLDRLGEAFRLFDGAIVRYQEVSYAPRFLRGSVAENLPWYFGKASVAREDFTDLLARAERNPDYITPKVLSFTYWAWARNRVQSEWFLSDETRRQALAAVDKAIALDPSYQGGRAKAEELKRSLTPAERSPAP